MSEKFISINYKKLRKSSPEAARMAVLDYLSSNGGNISECSKVFGVQRTVIYDIVTKSKEGNLTDRSRAPKTIPTKTSPVIEDIVITVKKLTNLPPKRLNYYLFKYHGVDIPYGTLRNILRRNKSKIY